MGVDLYSGNKNKGVRPEINVTPLVDVVLVLLIIFMVITPLLVRQFWVHIPEQEKKEVRQESKTNTEEPLVLCILPKNKLLINGNVKVSLEELPQRLKRVFAARDDHVLFVDIEDHANYGFAVEAMDRAREGGAVTIAVLTKPLAKN
ncbi:Biopolymer transport protein ExbD [Candidatus Methanoperedenaceae archaeon GB50]|nr:Biopolymer transport protein ExbD [Candidatus Methanoperedenaceae archaeon GB50]